MTPRPGHKENVNIVPITKDKTRMVAPSETTVGDLLFPHKESINDGSTNDEPLPEHPNGIGHLVATPEGELTNFKSAVEKTKVETDCSKEEGSNKKSPNVTRSGSHGSVTCSPNSAENTITGSAERVTNGIVSPDDTKHPKVTIADDAHKCPLSPDNDKIAPLATALKEKQKTSHDAITPGTDTISKFAVPITFTGNGRDAHRHGTTTVPGPTSVSTHVHKNHKCPNSDTDCAPDAASAIIFAVTPRVRVHHATPDGAKSISPKDPPGPGDLLGPVGSVTHGGATGVVAMGVATRKTCNAKTIDVPDSVVPGPPTG